MATTPKALRDSDLVDFANQTAGAGRASVIVEARRPAVTPSPATLARRTSTSPADVLPPPSKGRAGRVREAVTAQMRELESALKRMGLASKARRNDLAGSFVVEVTPRQLRELAEAPAVQAIRSNRFHRRVAA